MIIRYCTNCMSVLAKQPGFSRRETHWFCKGCGELLINPDVEDSMFQENTYPPVLDFCDECFELLNVQNGFETCGST